MKAMKAMKMSKKPKNQPTKKPATNTDHVQDQDLLLAFVFFCVCQISCFPCEFQWPLQDHFTTEQAIYHIAVRCQTKGCPSWVYLRKAAQWTICQMCEKPWKESMAKGGLQWK
jgi:hypothetical protein